MRSVKPHISSYTSPNNIEKHHETYKIQKMLALLELAGKYLIVGNDCTLTSSTSFAVASILATSIVS